MLDSDYGAPVKTTDLDLAHLRALLDAATPGPWRVSMSGYSVKSDDVDVPIVASVHHGAHATARDIERWLPNADLIAASRTVLPQLLARVEELERQAERFAWAVPANNTTRPAGCRCDLWPRGHCREGCPSGEVARLRALLGEACDIADNAQPKHAQIRARIAEIRREVER